MIKNKDFWVGLFLGAILVYLYCEKMKKGPGV